MSNVTTITIQEPTFWSKQDEESFFVWLNGIPAVKDVSGHSGGLDVRLDTGALGTDQLHDLIGLHMRYGLPMKSLTVLERSDNSQWFRDPDAYWFTHVFETL